MGNRLILFTNSYPYGPGETFLHEELPFTAAKFSEVIIYPLYIPNNHKPDRYLNSLPGNVVVKQALLPFDHKDKKRLLANGLFNFAPLFFSFKELFTKKVLFNSKNLWIFFNYLLILRAVLGNRKRMKEITDDLMRCNLSGEKKDNVVAYFYWGDKSALIIPFLKRRLAQAAAKGNKTEISMPEFVVRFHGSDLYEYAKGYLPFRAMLYKSVDYAVTISQSGADYIRENYKDCLPQNICVYRLGSCNPFFGNKEDELPILSESIKRVDNKGKIFRIVSCSNVIELKRVHIIVQALKEFGKELEAVLELAQQGMEEVCWTHIGDGPLLNDIKKECEGLPSFIRAEFKGSLPHDKVLEYYHSTGTDLFVQVSRSEGVPVAIMEALSFGIPVVATNVGGVNEIVNEKCGTLLPADLTPIVLKQAFISYMQMPADEYEKMRSNAIAGWQQNWNAVNNYKSFADFISNL